MGSAGRGRCGRPGSNTVRGSLRVQNADRPRVPLCLTTRSWILSVLPPGTGSLSVIRHPALCPPGSDHRPVLPWVRPDPGSRGRPSVSPSGSGSATYRQLQLGKGMGRREVSHIPSEIGVFRQWRQWCGSRLPVFVTPVSGELSAQRWPRRPAALSDSCHRGTVRPVTMGRSQ